MYDFKVEYDGTVIAPVSLASDECEIKYNYNSKVSNSAIDFNSIKSAITSAKDNYFTTTGVCTNGAGALVDALGDGNLFTVKFKAIGDGESIINLTSGNGAIFKDAKDEQFPVCVESIIVKVGHNTKDKETTTQKTESTTNSTTETATETTTEETTKKETTEVSTLKPVEKLTVKPIEKITTTEETTVVENETEETTAKIEFNVPTATATPVEFKDMAAHPWAKESVSLLSSLGIVKGTGWRIFEPNKNTTRADFLIIVKRLTGIEGSAENNFQDIDMKAYYAEAVGVITNSGLATGMTDTTFVPKENVTRQEVCAILARVLEKAGKLKPSDITALDKFVDEDFVSPYARQYLADLIGMGILSGNDKNKLRPVEPITRAEVCVLVKKVYDLIK